jgi:hypothetical protein
MQMISNYIKKKTRLIFFVYKEIILMKITMLFDYFDAVGEAIEFLMALGSIIGMLGLIIGILGWLFLGQFQRHKMTGVIIVSIVLLTICGIHTGIRYFRIYY